MQARTAIGSLQPGAVPTLLLPAYLRVGAAAYLAAMLLVATRLSVHGEGGWHWFAHAGLAMLIAATLIAADLHRQLWRVIRTDWTVWPLLAFFVYFLVQAWSHPDPLVSAQYLKDLLRNCGVAFVLGVLLFSAPATNRRSDQAAATVLAVAIVSTLLIALPQMRSDLFLIVQPSNVPPMYQYFGDYLILATLALLTVWASFSGPIAAHETWLQTWVLGLPFLMVLTFFAAQLIGSNGATVLLGLVAAVLGIGTLTIYLQRRAHRAASLILVSGIAACAVWLALIQLAPPLRIFNFGEKFAALEQPNGTDWRNLPGVSSISSRAPFAGSGANLPGVSSISSRAAFAGSGAKQLAIAPMFGDLAADRIAGSPGGYIHSLLSVQTHLGAVGSVLLLAYLLLRLNALYRAPASDIRKWLAPPVLLIAAAATFFTWMPFWFLVGALFCRPDSDIAVGKCRATPSR